MSTRTTEAQKARRLYLDKCHKNGAKPVSAEAFAKLYASKEARKARREAEKSAADVAAHKADAVPRKTVTHEVRVGDTVVLVDFTPVDALRMSLALAIRAAKTHRSGDKFVGNHVVEDMKTGEKHLVKCVKPCRKCKGK